jgi:hypothetical protein
MKMPTLMTPKNAVSASNMATDPGAQLPDLTARGVAQSKGFRWGSNFCKPNDDFRQHLVPNLCRFGEQIMAGYVASALRERLGSRRLGNRRSLNLDEQFSLQRM